MFHRSFPVATLHDGPRPSRRVRLRHWLLHDVPQVRAIVVSSVALVPALPLQWFGAVTVIAAVPAAGFQFHAAFTLARDGQGPPRGRSLRSGIGFVPILAYLGAGVLCLAEQFSGVGMSAVGTLTAIVVGILMSWIALVELLR